MDEYALINSKAIRKHCEKIQHRLNIEELAVLIYRNKTLSVEEKIQHYQELIDQYEDREGMERINSKYYDSVKEMMRGEIKRIQNLQQILRKEEPDVVYSYNYWTKDSRRKIHEGKREYQEVYKTFEEVKKLVFEEIEEEEEICSFCITKRTVSQKEKYTIRAEYRVDGKKEAKMVNLANLDGEWLDISNICLNLPTPFKKR